MRRPCLDLRRFFYTSLIRCLITNLPPNWVLQMNRDNKSIDHETLLAEFAALRAEILQRQSIQWNTFALQLTAAGVVFSFALSNPSHTGFLLILPVVTYALTGRYVSQSIGTEKVGIYIREVLDVKLKGQLHSRLSQLCGGVVCVFPGQAQDADFFACQLVEGVA